MVVIASSGNNCSVGIPAWPAGFTSDGPAGIGAKVTICININYTHHQGLVIHRHWLIDSQQLLPYAVSAHIAKAGVVASIAKDFFADQIMESLGTRDAEKMFNVGTNLDVGDLELEPPNGFQKLGPEDVGDGENSFYHDLNATQVKDTPMAPFAPLVPPP